MALMAKATRVLVMGLGHIGRSAARALLGDPGIRLAGAIDAAPGIAGRSLEDVLEDPRPGRLRVVPTLEEAPRGEVLVLTTSSKLAEIAPQVQAAVKLGLHVVSSCEELACPFGIDRPLAARLDRAARTAGVAVLGTGVNPGFVLDRFVLTLASATLNVERVVAERVVDLATRRLALREKTGVGRSPEWFAAAVAAGAVGHVGLEASARLVAEGLGWSAGEYVERVTPVIARRRLRGPAYDVPSGRVAGVRHQGVLLEAGVPRVLLRLEMAVGAGNPHDAVLIEGPVPVRAEVPGGLPGEPCTIAALVRGITAVRRARPGLVTPGDLPASPAG
jgi:4-hydroxy-tetrahydrodipicolinate reductase